MKIWVVTDAKGEIVGTMRVAVDAYKDGPVPGRPTAVTGQRVHEVELPPHLEETRDASVLHRELSKLVPRRRKTARKHPASARKPR
jgi:hypothetical protein